MKFIRNYSLILAFFLFVFSTGLKAQQSNKKVYSSTSLEFIFFFADVSTEGHNVTNVMRFAPFLNIQWLYNFDLSNNVGLYTGIDLRNLGFIRQNKTVDPNIKIKHRVYTLGIPIGIKLGNFNQMFFAYLGGEIEWAFNYKEKYFENNNKIHKFVEWNSQRVNQWQTSVFLGINFPYGINLKFKYYFENLLNQDYTLYHDDGTISQPYKGQNSQIFYFSFNFFMFQPMRTYTSNLYLEKDMQKAQRARLERNSLF